jgi:hypothetical protein
MTTGAVLRQGALCFRPSILLSPSSLRPYVPALLRRTVPDVRRDRFVDLHFAFPPFPIHCSPFDIVVQRRSPSIGIRHALCVFILRTSSSPPPHLVPRWRLPVPRCLFPHPHSAASPTHVAQSHSPGPSREALWLLSRPFVAARRNGGMACAKHPAGKSPSVSVLVTRLAGR